MLSQGRVLPPPLSHSVALVEVDAIEFGRVLGNDFPGDLGRHVGKVFLDDFQGIGPGRIRMREV